MSAVARTLNVARSQINERRGGTSKPRGPYRKAEDAEFLPSIRAIVDARPTYGYRRVTALLRTAGCVLKASPRSMPSACCGSCSITG